MPRSSCSYTLRHPPVVRLTIYRRGAPETSGVYDRFGAALRLRLVRHREDFRGHKTEPATLAEFFRTGLPEVPRVR